MKIVDFSMDDARKCADLIALLTATNKLIDSIKLAGIQVQGPSAASKEQTLAWVKEIATHMANEIAARDREAKAPAVPPAPAKTSTLPAAKASKPAAKSATKSISKPKKK